MPRVIAYIRVSTERQDAENQLTGIQYYAKTNGLVIDEVVGETISGFKAQLTERKFSEVMESLQEGDTLIVSETSRLSRRLIDVLNIINQLIEQKVRVITVKEGIAFQDDINSKVLAFAFGLAAEIERSLISARTKEALAKLKADGVKLGRPVGSSRPEALKLFGTDEQIIKFLIAKMPLAAIARYFGVHPDTMRRHIERQQLRKEAMWQSLETNA